MREKGSKLDAPLSDDVEVRPAGQTVASEGAGQQGGHIGDVKRRLGAAKRWIKTLQDGLAGNPHRIGAGEADAMEKSLAKIDIYLYSKTRASKFGMELKRGAKPVVYRYYTAPIAATRPLFCAEQFKRISLPAPDSNAPSVDGLAGAVPPRTSAAESNLDAPSFPEGESRK